eukprot:11196590-Lingulodinium_polyedra.AAC.1
MGVVARAGSHHNHLSQFQHLLGDGPLRKVPMELLAVCVVLPEQLLKGLDACSVEGVVLQAKAR